MLPVAGDPPTRFKFITGTPWKNLVKITKCTRDKPINKCTRRWTSGLFHVGGSGPSGEDANSLKRSRHSLSKLPLSLSPSLSLK